MILSATSLFAGEAEVEVHFPKNVSEFTFSAAAKHGGVVFRTPESLPPSEAWDRALFQGLDLGGQNEQDLEAPLSFEVSRLETSGWSAWRPAQTLRRYKNGRFWGSAIFQGAAKVPLRLRVIANGPLAKRQIRILEIAVFDSSAKIPEEKQSQPKASAPNLKAEALDAWPEPPVHAREEWKARAAKNPYIPDSPNKITIHHTAGIQTSELDKTFEEVRFIQDFHMDGRGWDDIAYHFLVDAGGNVVEGRPEQVWGAHVRGHNDGNIGIALIGDYEKEKDAMTPAQQATVVALARYLVSKYNIDPNDPKADPPLIAGHRDYNPATTCPGDVAHDWLPTLRQDAAVAVPHAVPPVPAVKPQFDEFKAVLPR